MKDYIWGHLFMALFIINLIPFLIGIISAGYSRCNSNWAKIEYLVPGFRVGCYMGSPFSED